MFKNIIFCYLFSITSILADFKFLLNNQRQITEPIVIQKNELFNTQYITDKIFTYTFEVLDSNNKIIYTRTENTSPYYLFGNANGIIKYGLISLEGLYTINVKETNEKINFKVDSNFIPTTSCPVNKTTTSINNIDISYCNKGFPVPFDKTKDHISLHYDMSYDPDDYLSAVADRSILDTEYGFDFLRDRTSRVIGTCGGSCSGYNTPANKLMEYTFGDVGGYEITIAANDPDKYTKAMNYELAFYKSTIQRGGRIFVKEGGESDFTKRIIEQLEKWITNSGKCVYIVQHSSTNEKNNGAGVLSYVKNKSNYIKISDGNPLYKKSNWSLNGKTFDFYGLQSKWECAWKYAFDVFKKKKSYCNGSSQPVQKCVDFSDTHELLYIIGINSSTSSNNLGINGFVQKYLKSSIEKIKCI